MESTLVENKKLPNSAAIAWFKKLAVSSLLVVGAVIVTCLAIEFSIRLWHVFRPLPNTLTEMKISGEVPALTRAPYFNAQFFDDSLANFFFFTPPGTRRVVPSDVRRRYVSTSGNHRVTTFTPDKYKNTVYLLGGSTTFCQEVPDALTIASQLQFFMNRFQGGGFKIENFGTPGQMLFQQNQVLESLEKSIRPGDIVVFYDGGNDIHQSVYFNNPQGVAVLKEENFQRLDFLKKMTHFIPALEHLEIVKTLRVMQEAKPPTYLADTAKMNEIIARFVRNQRLELEKAKTLSESHGAKFYHFNQPYIFTKSKLTENERLFVENPRVTFAGTEKGMRLGSEARAALLRSLKAEGFETFDLRNAFDDLTSDIYLDWIHVNYLGNGKIAEKIYAALFSDHAIGSFPSPEQIWKEYMNRLQDPNRVLLAQAVLATAVKGLRSDGLSWFTAKKPSIIDGRQWVNYSNQAFFSVDIPRGARAVRFEYNLQVSKMESEILNDLVWYQDSVEVERGTSEYKNWLGKDYIIESPEFPVPSKANKVLVILRPYQKKDGELMIPNAGITWLK